MADTFTVERPSVVRRAQGVAWSKLGDVPIDKRLLQRMGHEMVLAFSREAAKDFSMRGWSMASPIKGGKPIHKSFSYRLSGGGLGAVEILSTWPGMADLVRGVPSRKMDWLTQEHKDRHPSQHALSPRERKLGMRRTGRVSKGQRLPLIVPLRAKGGAIVFRTAPLKIADAWVHPGIARFTFAQRAVRKVRTIVAAILRAELLDRLRKGDPFQ